MERRFSAGPWRRCWAVFDARSGAPAQSNGAPWLCETEGAAAALAEAAETAWRNRPCPCGPLAGPYTGADDHADMLPG